VSFDRSFSLFFFFFFFLLFSLLLEQKRRMGAGVGEKICSLTRGGV
jgi:hypothetical protein